MWPEIPQKWQKWTNLGCVCFGWKMISGNHFPPNPHVWLQRKMKFSENSFPVDQYLLLWPENDFTLSFSLQIISGKREREREKREPRSERKRGRRDKRAHRTIAPLVDQWARSQLWSTRGAIDKLVDRAPHRLQLRVRSSIDERRDRRAVRSSDERARRSRRLSNDRTDLAFTTRSHLLLCRAISIWPNLMNFFIEFCFFCEWVWNWFIICMFTVKEVYGKLGM